MKGQVVRGPAGWTGPELKQSEPAHPSRSRARRESLKLACAERVELRNPLTVVCCAFVPG